MTSRSKLSTLWYAALVASTAGVVLLIGLPRKKDAPQPIVSGPPSVGPRPALDDGLLSSVNAILSPPVSDKDIEPEPMVARIVALGPGATDVIVALLCGDAEGREVAVGSLDRPVHPRALELRDQVLHDALDQFPIEARLEAILDRGTGADVRTRLALFPLLASIPDRRALRALLEQCADVDPNQWLYPYVAGIVERALAEQLVRNPEFVNELDPRSQRFDPRLTAVLVRAAASVRTSITLRFVTEQLGRDETVDLEVLRSLGRMLSRGRMPVPADTSLLVERCATSTDPALRRAAVEALGALGEEGSLDTMLAALSDSDALVAHSARRGLTALAGTDRGEQPEHWAQWDAEERRWRDAHFDRIAAQLGAQEPGVVVRAIQTLVAHPLCRHQAAELIAPLALGDCEAVSTAAVDALGVLASGRAIPPLIGALEQPEATRREHACSALRRLTGLDLPAEPERWRAVLTR